MTKDQPQSRAYLAVIVGIVILVCAIALVVYARRGWKANSASPVEPSASGEIIPDNPQTDSALRFPFMPDPARTPGATLEVTAADICVSGYSKRVRSVPVEVKRQVYASYGIRSHKPGEYEVDHLISLELGGSNSVRNLWPESYLTRPWNAHVKDALENELHRRVCAGTLDLAKAQRVIASNWVTGYRTYVNPTPLSPNSRSRSGSRARRRQRVETQPEPAVP